MSTAIYVTREKAQLIVIKRWIISPQGDHTPDSVTFLDNSTTPAHTHIMPVLVLLSVASLGMQQCMIRNQNEMHKLSKVNYGRKYAANNKQF